MYVIFIHMNSVHQSYLPITFYYASCSFSSSSQLGPLNFLFFSPFVEPWLGLLMMFISCSLFIYFVNLKMGV